MLLAAAGCGLLTASVASAHTWTSPGSGDSLSRLRARMFSGPIELVPSEVVDKHYGVVVGISGDGNTVLASDVSKQLVVAYTNQNGTWSEQQVITGTDPAYGGPDPSFGLELINLSNDGNTALIAGDLAGWVFYRAGNTWSLQQELRPASPSIFGEFVGLSSDGSTAVVSGVAGATPLTSVYQRTGSTWAPGEPVSVTTGRGEWDAPVVAMAANGRTMAIGGDTLALYDRSPTGWTLRQQIKTMAGHKFAVESMSLSGNGNTLLVDAPTSRTTGTCAFFTRTSASGQWKPQTILRGIGCGHVALSANGNAALLGASLFTRSGTGWKLRRKIAPPAGGIFSKGISANGAVCVIGTLGHVYVYRLTP